LIHVSESEAECRWIASDDADLDKFLVAAFRRELPALEWRGHGLSPVKHLERHNLLRSNVVAAHLAQVDESDIECLAKHQVSAVHCPRSNSRLRNGVAPLQKLIKAGLKLGLGTDSAASTDDLDLLAEARFAWDLHRAIDKDFSETAEKALYYLTLGAAEALHMNDNIGSLEPGKKADFAVFDTGHLAEIARQRPYECLIYGGAKLKSLTVDGIELLKDGCPSKNSDLTAV
jgi:5-methylthioadenosine/S-adenosylhomocysteine deaminase